MDTSPDHFGVICFLSPLRANLFLGSVKAKTIWIDVHEYQSSLLRKNMSDIGMNQAVDQRNLEQFLKHRSM
jgi:hypothetical protein